MTVIGIGGKGAWRTCNDVCTSRHNSISSSSRGSTGKQRMVMRHVHSTELARCIVQEANTRSVDEDKCFFLIRNWANVVLVQLTPR